MPDLPLHLPWRHARAHAPGRDIACRLTVRPRQPRPRSFRRGRLRPPRLDPRRPAPDRGSPRIRLPDPYPSSTPLGTGVIGLPPTLRLFVAAPFDRRKSYDGLAQLASEALGPRVGRPAVEAANRTWAMGFRGDALSDGRKIRLLNVLDPFTRECLAIRVDRRLTGSDVVEVLAGLVAARGAPRSLKTDNGPESAGRPLDLWGLLQRCGPGLQRARAPTDNAFIDRSTGGSSEECLNRHRFLCFEDAREKTSWWRHDSNEERPHGALGNLAPGEFARNQAGVDGPRSMSKLS